MMRDNTHGPVRSFVALLLMFSLVAVAWPIATAAEPRTWKVADSYVATGFALSPVDPILIYQKDQTLEAWDTASGKLLWSNKVDQELAWFNALAISPDGRLLSVPELGGRPAKMAVYETRTGKSVRTFKAASPSVAVTTYATSTFLPNSGGLAVPQQSSVQLWDIASGNRVATLPAASHQVYRLWFSPDGALAAGLSMARTATDLITFQTYLTLWNIKSQRVVTPIIPSFGLPDGAVAFSPDNRLLAHGFNEDGRRVAREILAFPGKALTPHGIDPTKLKAPNVNMSHIYIRDTATGKTTGTYEYGARWQVGQTSWILAQCKLLRFSPDNQTLIEASWDKNHLQAQLRDVKTGVAKEVINRNFAEGEDVASVALSPDGRILAAAMPRHRVDLWELEKGEKLKSLQGPAEKFGIYLSEKLETAKPESLLYSSDGKRLVTLAWFGEVLDDQKKAKGEVCATAWELD